MPEEISSQPKPHKVWLFVLLGFLAIFLALGFAFFLLIKDRMVEIEKQQNTALYGLRKLVGADSIESKNYLGSDKPKVTIVEFADYACQYSKAQYPTLRDFLFKHSNDVKFIFRDFPIIADESLDLAMSANCAGEQGLFWQMHDYLYDHQGIKSKLEIFAAAKAIGADKLKFAACMENQKYLPQIKKDAQTADSFNYNATPVLIVNGYALPQGNVPADYLEKVYQELIKK